MKPFLQRTWAQIDLDAIEYNYLKIRESESDALFVNEDVVGLRAPDRSEPSFIRPIIK